MFHSRDGLNITLVEKGGRVLQWREFHRTCYEEMHGWGRWLYQFAELTETAASPLVAQLGLSQQQARGVVAFLEGRG